MTGSPPSRSSRRSADSLVVLFLLSRRYQLIVLAAAAMVIGMAVVGSHYLAIPVTTETTPVRLRTLLAAATGIILISPLLATTPYDCADTGSLRTIRMWASVISLAAGSLAITVEAAATGSALAPGQVLTFALAATLTAAAGQVLSHERAWIPAAVVILVAVLLQPYYDTDPEPTLNLTRYTEWNPVALAALALCVASTPVFIGQRRHRELA